MSTFPKIQKNNIETLQVNLGYKCNQTCIHCHVNASPSRVEMMDKDTIYMVPKVLEAYGIKCLDITGGAPELHPDFKELVLLAKSLDVKVIDRCNLTILTEPGQQDLSNFLADNKVVVTASLPCYEGDNVDKQRGEGVFKRSIYALKLLNKLGYGLNNSELVLNLVYNPQGTKLPPSQKELELAYRNHLRDKYNIYFNNLFTITNMPIKRFADHLKKLGQFDEYIELLKSSHNINNLDSIMCKTLISVDWQGYIFDCDFNQQLGIGIAGNPLRLKDLISSKKDFFGTNIIVGDHCFGCTAGNGSSCTGSLSN